MAGRGTLCARARKLEGELPPPPPPHSPQAEASTCCPPLSTLNALARLPGAPALHPFARARLGRPPPGSWPHNGPNPAPRSTATGQAPKGGGRG